MANQKRNFFDLQRVKISRREEKTAQKSRQHLFSVLQKSRTQTEKRRKQSLRKSDCRKLEKSSRTATQRTRKRQRNCFAEI